MPPAPHSSLLNPAPSFLQVQSWSSHFRTTDTLKEAKRGEPKEAPQLSFHIPGQLPSPGPAGMKQRKMIPDKSVLKGGRKQGHQSRGKGGGGQLSLPLSTEAGQPCLLLSLSLWSSVSVSPFLLGS